MILIADKLVGNLNTKRYPIRVERKCARENVELPECDAVKKEKESFSSLYGPIHKIFC